MAESRLDGLILGLTISSGCSPVGDGCHDAIANRSTIQTINTIMNTPYFEPAIIKLLSDNQAKMAETIAALQDTIGNKLDSIVTGLSNIKIQAESVNLNTDGLENLIVATNTKLDTQQTSLNSINSKIATATNQVDKGKLNPTHIAAVAAGDTIFDQDVVLCNITNNPITVSVTAKDDTTAVSIVIQPGWCPVIVKSITGATENTLVYGW